MNTNTIVQPAATELERVRDTYYGTCFPGKTQLVRELAALGIKSQTTDSVVTDSDWRSSDYDLKGELNSLYVILDDGESGTVFAVFDVSDNSFDYCIA